MGRRKTNLSRLTRKAKKERMKRAHETEEERKLRLQKTNEMLRLKRENETPEERALRLKKNLLSKCPRKSKRKQQIIYKQRYNRTQTAYETAGLENQSTVNNDDWHQSFALMRQLLNEPADMLQTIVKEETLEDNQDTIISDVDDNIEFDAEVKVEIDCDSVLLETNEVMTIKQENDGTMEMYEVKIKQENEATMETNEEGMVVVKQENEATNDVYVSSLIPSTSSQVFAAGTKFSQMGPIKYKDEALGVIKKLESFALNKKDLRLIGFIDRLQNHFEKSY